MQIEDAKEDLAELFFQCARYERPSTDWREALDKFTEQVAAAEREAALYLLNHIEDVVDAANWERIDPKLWNAVTMRPNGWIEGPRAFARSLSNDLFDPYYTPLIPAFEALRRDAERYRWLRNLAVLYNNVPGVWMAVDATPDENNYLGGRELDAAVDAAMKVPNDSGKQPATTNATRDENNG